MSSTNLETEQSRPQYSMTPSEGEYLTTRRSLRLCAKSLLDTAPARPVGLDTCYYANGANTTAIACRKISKPGRCANSRKKRRIDNDGDTVATPSKDPTLESALREARDTNGVKSAKSSDPEVLFSKQRSDLRSFDCAATSGAECSETNAVTHGIPYSELDVASVRDSDTDTITVAPAGTQYSRYQTAVKGRCICKHPKSRKSLIVKLRIGKPQNDETILEQNASAVTPRKEAGLLTPPASVSRKRDLLQVDEKLLRISRLLSHRLPLASKPATQGKPQVWAESRQALCETLSYFKSTQGGCYHNDGHIYGFLRDNAGYEREYMDSDVIVSRIGSGMEASKDGRLSQTKDHDRNDARIRAFLAAIEYQNPLVVICGDRCEDSICKMPYRYCVLGWYKPIAIWAEKTRGTGKIARTTIKYRLERLCCDEPAWHAPLEEAFPGLQEEPMPAVKHTCSVCKQEYPQVYLSSWMCLNERCCEFWKMNGHDAVDLCDSLDFHPGFLLNRTRWQIEQPPHDLRPPIPKPEGALGDHLTYINTRGICCPKCGRCSSRRLFKGWHCDNPRCDFTYFLTRSPVGLTVLHNPWSILGDGPGLSRNDHDAAQVKLSVKFIEGYKIYVYVFEGIRGHIVHAVSNAKINSVSKGPNSMFQTMQVEDFRLERRRFSSKPPKCVLENGEGCTNVEKRQHVQRDVNPHEDGDYMMAFSMNFGMPYKFAADGTSASFDEGPEAVRVCRSLLNHAARSFLPESAHEDFNEELVIAYMQGQKMEYHDDGEKGLGPQIATLSLGGPAKMHFRMKAKHFVGCSKQGILVAEKPVSCSTDKDAYDSRLRAWEEVEMLQKQENRTGYDRRRRELPHELGLYANRLKKAKDLLTVTLQHGDIVIMDGHEIQTYLEHKVVPSTHLRFAITCRAILRDHLAPEEQPAHVVTADGGCWDPTSEQPWRYEPVTEPVSEARNGSGYVVGEESAIV